MSFDFQGAKFSPQENEADREILGWAFNQFLYGEVTGIQIGHWLYNAPDMDAARFLAKQALEEFQHIRNFLRILYILNVKPTRPHRLVRFLSTGMMPDEWSEHVAIEMAQGEGMVLTAFYALIDTVDHPEITKILQAAVKQEENHVRFGEERTRELVRNNPGLRKVLLGQALLSLYAVRRLGTYMEKRSDPAHPVMSKLSDFIEHVASAGELRMVRMGLLDKTAGEISALKKSGLVVYSVLYNFLKKLLKWPGRIFKFLPFGRQKRLTETYLEDPGLLNFQENLRLETPPEKMSSREKTQV